METVEMMIFIMFAFITGALIIGVLAGWDIRELFKSIKDVFIPKEETKFEKVSIGEFPKRLFQFRGMCESTDQNITMRLYLEGNGTLEKADIFKVVKELSWCANIQSAEFRCGNREDIVMNASKLLPDLVVVACADGKLVIT